MNQHFIKAKSQRIKPIRKEPLVNDKCHTGVIFGPTVCFEAASAADKPPPKLRQDSNIYTTKIGR
jgi:hypothetical protein